MPDALSLFSGCVCVQVEYTDKSVKLYAKCIFGTEESDSPLVVFYAISYKDAELIYKHLNCEAYAEDVLKQYGAELTPYGMVNRADFGPLHEPIPEQQQEQTQEPQMEM